jgi:probable rRNA maturation factor
VDAPEIKIFVEAGDWPPKRKLQRIAKRAVKAAIEALSKEASRYPSPNPSPQGGGELSLVFSDDTGIRALNARYRGKDRATNVLSFPQKAGALLGDVILAAETVAREAALADKPLEDHMAHLIIHGFLHLLGFDHQRDGEAEKMEQLERVALKSLGISDPYAPANPK